MRVKTSDPNALANVALSLKQQGDLYGSKRKEIIEQFRDMIASAPDGIAVAQIVEATKHCGLWPQVYPAVKAWNDTAIEKLEGASSASEIDEVINLTQDENGIMPRVIWARARARVCELASEITQPAQLSELTSLAALAKARGMWRVASEHIQEADTLLNSILEHEVQEGTLILKGGSETVMPDNVGHARRLYEAGYTEV